MYDDEDDEADLEERVGARDPIAIAGAAIVIGVAADIALDVWTYWDQIPVTSAGDRLRMIAPVLSAYVAMVLLLGVVLLRLRSLLGMERSWLDDRITRTGTGFGFAIALVFVIGSVAAAADVVLHSSDNGLDELTARLQYAGRYAIAGAIAAAAAWVATCEAPREPAPIAEGPDDDYDPGDFDPETFRPYAGG